MPRSNRARAALLPTAFAAGLFLQLPAHAEAQPPQIAQPDAADASASAYRPRRLVRSELFFAAVDAAAWDDFLSRVVTPAFPDGLSWYDVHGQWRGAGGATEKLPSRVLVIIHGDSAANERALRQISEVFRQQFGYAVLRVAEKVLASDPDWTPQRLSSKQMQTSSGDVKSP